MRRHRPLRVTYADRPFRWMFPRLHLAMLVIGGLARAITALVRGLWPYWREITTIATLWGAWRAVGLIAPPGWATPLTLLLLTMLACIRPVRGWVLGWWAAGRTRRRLLAGLVSSRCTDPDGRPPRLRRITATPIGQRAFLRLRPGQSVELLESRTEELRAAVRARDVRLHRDEHRADRVSLDVVRRDSLTSGVVAWADEGAEVLSIWDPVHWGVSELGRPVRLSLVERAVLIGGNRGAGKSSAINLFVAHAAKSPDVVLLLIDANRVQLAPWQERAHAFADHDPDTAIGVVRLWRDEIDRRLATLASLPGLPLALTRDLAGEHAMPMWLLVIDELAYHTSVAGTPVQQREFSTLLRDGVARGRAAGMGVIVATQRPTHDLIPTSLRDLFDIRIAYRTMTRVSSDVILGDGFARRGYTATDIGLHQRGVCWLLAHDRDPIRTKTAWISPRTRAELAVTTVRYRPGPPRPHLGGRP